MAIATMLMRMDRGRRQDDFTADIIDAAIELQRSDGTNAARAFLDANHIDGDLAQRILFGQRHLLRASDLPSQVPAGRHGDSRVNN